MSSEVLLVCIIGQVHEKYSKKFWRVQFSVTSVSAVRIPADGAPKPKFRIIKDVKKRKKNPPIFTQYC